MLAPKSKFLLACAATALLAVTVSGCLSNGGGNPNLTMLDLGSLQTQNGISLNSRDGPAADTAPSLYPVNEQRVDPSSPDAPVSTDTAMSQNRETPESNPTATQSKSVSGTDMSGIGASDQDPLSSDNQIVTGTQPGGRSLAEPPRNNPEAADLLDHWGHRRVQQQEGLSLSTAAPEARKADLERLLTATQTPSGKSPIPNLNDDDEVGVSGAHRGVTYGRWTGGPADTLSIDFDLSRAGPAMQDNPAFRAMLERAGKMWSYRIADTWTAWERTAGDRKGPLLPDFEEVRVGENGELSTGVEIHVTDTENLAVSGRTLTSSGGSPPDAPWEPRFGSIEIDREHLQDQQNQGANLFSTLTHEIGHVLGAWKFDAITEPYADYSNTATGTWTGPNVVAVHGGPAPFQDEADPISWVEGERHPFASEYDFSHSGVCASLMSYCGSNASLLPFLPHAIDFAFLADLGMTIREDTDRPETYGLAGWTDYAAFTVSVSRDLRVKLADPQPYFDAWGNIWQTLDISDLLQAGVDVFGYRSTRDFHLSYPAAGLDETAHYTGGLLGTAIDRAGLPPVIGDSSLAVDFRTLDGAASFTSLKVYTEGTPETFAGGALHYPFELSDNAIIGTDSESTLSADFYGPWHEDVAGTLHDPSAGLLASFGASYDDRPTREDVVASSDYIAGLTLSTERFSNSDGSSYNQSVWYESRCEPDCQVRSLSDGVGIWKPADKAQVLSSTAGWDWRSEERLDADYDFVRVTRGSQASTDGARGRYVADSYAGTQVSSAFSTGFENYVHWLAEPGAESLINPKNVWSGVQGILPDTPIDEIAGWSGRMLGYQQIHGAFESPFVEGLATVKFSLSNNSLDLAFSEVSSRDGKREVADFGFDDLGLEGDSTFSLWDTSGLVFGALFGLAHEEAAGAFQHNQTNILGSFGARRLPNTVTLEQGGTATLDEGLQMTVYILDEEILILPYNYDDWGFWAKQFGQDIFGALIDRNLEESSLFPGISYLGDPFGRIEGTPSGINPVSGTAVWSGKVRAFESLTGILSYEEVNYAPVNGNARLGVDFSDATVDVDFTGFDRGHSDMSWRNLRIQGGTFTDSRVRPTIGGAFYGNDHQGVAGTFNYANLQGVFGAVRN